MFRESLSKEQSNWHAWMYRVGQKFSLGEKRPPLDDREGTAERKFYANGDNLGIAFILRMTCALLYTISK